MKIKKIKFKNKNIKINVYVIIIFIVLGLMVLFSITNLIAIIELRKQVELILNASTLKTNNVLPVSQISVPIKTQFITTNTPVVTNPIEPVFDAETKIYSNVTSEPFFGPYLIDSLKTNMRLDNKVTSMTFQPVYTFKKSKSCEESFCGLLNTAQKLYELSGQIYYGDKKIDLPSEVKDKKIVNFNFSQLDKKWIIGLVALENEREVGYVYLFDGQKLETLINSETPQQIKTQYNYTGGSISAGGSDNQFIILYSGYEGFGYLYNNGIWQNLSQYFGLRVTSGGFKAKVIRGGYGNLATWYICSDTVNKPKLIKLWQNNTSSIQGGIDLTEVFGNNTAICSSEGNREIKIARDDGLYSFVDKGFNNSHAYTYQSINLSDFIDKKIVSVQLRSYFINAPVNLYNLAVSTDLTNWQLSDDGVFNFDNSSQNTFYIKANFKTGNAEYSPWFSGVEIISYTAKDLK